ncbi:NADH:flavin oxidoreductase [Chitinophaga filiformis]|uniref:NADH:flavin oxidoreductase n=1 Tax=Chitinophaga filiformis TaxID=104663 RepID=UPI001F25F85E|nr:NADH:flavin oxidoreductase [Chitinophaga filiformis]MCF6407609.1 NADH:flavin oxidoreductase [Chitinophaga filiformis]MCF6407686.1 NADH:flavin oxidoreductase [Chitinophaga filiformis]
MNTNTDILFQPIKLGSHTLKNRFTVAPMTRRSATATGVPTNEMADYYAAFAAGGFGLIITEGTYTDNLFSKTDNHQPGLVTHEQVEGWKKVTDKVHQADPNALIILQLMHGGALSQHSAKTIAPSAIQPKGLRNTEPGGLQGPFPLPSAMSRKDMQEAKDGFVQTAIRALIAGFDGVEIHAANGYLLDQFITPHTNVREDEYGGNYEKRLRFPIEVFTAIKAAVPKDFIVGIRLSESKVNDLTYRWPGGAATAKEIFNILKQVDVSYIHIASEGGNWARESLYDNGSSSNGIAKQITGKPVIVNGGMHDTALATKLISNHEADLISIGRTAITNPDLPEKIKNGTAIAPFFKELIKDSLTLAHTKEVLKAKAITTTTPAAATSATSATAATATATSTTTATAAATTIN